MTQGEWLDVVNEVVSLFGSSSKWSKSDDAYKHVRNLNYQTAMDVVQDMFNDGLKHPPSMSEIVTATRNRGGVTRNLSQPCKHVTFAIFEYHDDGTAAEGMCTGCRTEMVWSSGKIRSVGDIEERARVRREDADAVAP